MRTIDLALISGRRPELLARTLASFQERMFQKFSIGKVVANIDPFAGDESAHSKCRETILEMFPMATLIEPMKPSFGRAVKQAWAATTGDMILHLEDDWILDDEVRPLDVNSRLEGCTVALQLAHQDLEWDGPFKHAFDTRRILGIYPLRRKINIFGTSPGFWKGDVARYAASLMDPELDPEKQMRPNRNKRLFDYLNQYKCGVLTDSAGGNLIHDIGRAWRDDRNLMKVVRSGKSIWEEKDVRAKEL